MSGTLISGPACGGTFPRQPVARHLVAGRPPTTGTFLAIARPATARFDNSAARLQHSELCASRPNSRPRPAGAGGHRGRELHRGSRRDLVKQAIDNEFTDDRVLTGGRLDSRGRCGCKPTATLGSATSVGPFLPPIRSGRAGCFRRGRSRCPMNSTPARRIGSPQKPVRGKPAQSGQDHERGRQARPRARQAYEDAGVLALASPHDIGDDPHWQRGSIKPSRRRKLDAPTRPVGRRHRHGRRQRESRGLNRSPGDFPRICPPAYTVVDLGRSDDAPR